jgi:hypothetical protein
MDRRFRSAAFSEYNRARKVFERSRVNKALGLVLSRRIEDRQLEYGTTLKPVHYCGCPDNYHRGVLCKHIMALMLLERMHRPRNRPVDCYHIETFLTFHTKRDSIVRKCADCKRIVEEIPL